ncbi:hypothetical protein K493DRAFT_303406 [Basidiobolus meristosporus CBS 931.73]|uniref:Uncharacterized protein n=1 Tax=Basidiobolus meristosporus CBS 931.73 TaxID=1314790 RepID=A0A1Y1Y2X0_9FUNG|nr:hypothetical protein K493DRAFT_303406 [Basidiobolus meristosporus CBS 931.73]|eukprot:ORX92343.1 hypothetical protein K493DRAFT_303406 [Basidiobolus meristosporus CBS 931.73]
MKPWLIVISLALHAASQEVQSEFNPLTETLADPTDLFPVSIPEASQIPPTPTESLGTTESSSWAIPPSTSWIPTSITFAPSATAQASNIVSASASPFRSSRVSSTVSSRISQTIVQASGTGGPAHPSYLVMLCVALLASLTNYSIY